MNTSRSYGRLKELVCWRSWVYLRRNLHFRPWLQPLQAMPTLPLIRFWSAPTEMSKVVAAVRKLGWPLCTTYTACAARSALCMLSSRSTKKLILEDDTYALTRSAVRLHHWMLEPHTIAQTKRRALVHTQKKTERKTVNISRRYERLKKLVS